MSGLLTEMAQTSLARLAQARAKEPESALWTRASDAALAPRLKLSPEGFDILAECKLHSPSAGDLSAHTRGVVGDVQNLVLAYAQGGACAISVLTEPTRFGGSLDHLAQAVRVLEPLDVPVMRKDFLVDPYQVMEARAAGASGVLVIVRMLERCHLTELLDCAAMLKMFVLLEAFDAEDLTAARDLLEARKQHEEQVLIGLNCRDLDTLQIDLARLAELADRLPAGYVPVAESGITSLEDVSAVVDSGYRVALIGTTLMTAGDPKQLLGDMLAAGRARAAALHPHKIDIAAGAANPQ